MSQRARNVLPDGVVSALKSIALAWGWLTAGARMTPDLIIVGAQRCGTTTLYRVLSEHPALVRPTFAKGIGYFDVNHHRGMRWYRAHFPLRAVARLTRRGAGAEPMAFESGGYYCFHPLAAERIARELPGVRLVLLVRDPVQRAYSAHKHEAARGFEDLSFTEALDAEPTRLAGEEDRMRADPRYASFEHRHHGYVARGEYIDQVRRLEAAVGPDRLWVMDAEDFFEDPGTEISRLLDWLGLPPWQPTEVARWNARPSSPMAPGTRARLEEQFRLPDLELAEHLGRTPSWRRSGYEGEEPASRTR